jgi:uncharacterized membrane protein
MTHHPIKSAAIAAALLTLYSHASFSVEAQATNHQAPSSRTYVRPPAYPVSLAPWVECAAEGSKCNFPLESGARVVRYGTATKFTTRAFLVSPRCNDTAFGADPAPGEQKTCQYGPVLRRTIPASTSTMMGPSIDRTRIPTGHPGDTQLSVRPTAQQASEDGGIGAFRTHCFFSHMGFNDPIVYPGQAGASHLHTFFGNTLTSHASTVWSIKNRGNSTCSGGLANRSAYWTPSVIDTRNATPIAPREMGVYYKSGYGGILPSEVIALPAGLRMISGDMRSSQAQSQSIAYWECTAGESGYRSPNSPQGKHGSIPACKRGETLMMVIQFPQCWDGVRLDSPDHKSHMAYPRNGCPSTHPKAIPIITFKQAYNVTSDEDHLYWRLSSDMYGTEKPGGFSLHGDWFIGWNAEIVSLWTKNCLNASLDCHADLLNNGYELSEAKMFEGWTISP